MNRHTYIQYTSHSAQHTTAQLAHSTQYSCTVDGTQHAVHSTQPAIYSIYYAVHSARCRLYILHRTRYTSCSVLEITKLRRRGRVGFEIQASFANRQLVVFIKLAIQNRRFY